jgi:hypothetical protein
MAFKNIYLNRKQRKFAEHQKCFLPNYFSKCGTLWNVIIFCVMFSVRKPLIILAKCCLASPLFRKYKSDPSSRIRNFDAHKQKVSSTVRQYCSVMDVVSHPRAMPSTVVTLLTTVILNMGRPNTTLSVILTKIGICWQTLVKVHILNFHTSV